jgi:hypothetical protein
MDDVLKVKATPIELGSFIITVMQMPNGSYCLSRTDVADLINNPRQSFTTFLGTNSDLALPYKDFVPQKARIEGTSGAPSDAIPIKIATAYWRYWDKKDNLIASAIVDACVQESIERRADVAFGVIRSEQERNERFTTTVESYVLNEPIPWNSKINGVKPFIIEFYEHLYRIRGGDWLKRDPRVSRRPACVGAWTNKFIYDLFPDSVPEALRQQYKNQPGNHKKYEFLTQKIGRTYLALHMAALLALMRAANSNNWSRFVSDVEKGIPSGSMQGIQLELDFLIEIEDECAKRLEES